MPTLSWLTRDDDIRAADKVPYRLLEEVPALGAGDPASENILIQGDNLEALKSLLPYYRGAVKCIYIDPPYNTRSAFEHYDDNLEHSQWLAMMWPRLELLRELLREDGTFLVSANDDEAHYLKVMCDELFGRRSFVGAFVWHYEGNTDNQAQIINYHEYVLAYHGGRFDVVGSVVDPNISDDSKLRKEFIRNTVVKNGVKNPKSAIRVPAGFPAPLPDGIVDTTRLAFPKWSGPLHVADGKLKREVVATSGWSSKEILTEFIDGGFLPVSDSKGQPTRFELTATGNIDYVKERSAAKGHIVSVLRGFGTTNQARLMLEALGLGFSYPKPVDLIAYLVRIFSGGTDLVLDSFLGSGTTGHAVLKANREDGGTRRFIGVEVSSDTATNIARPRLTAVIEGAAQAGIQRLGGGFRFYKLGPKVFDEQGRIRDGIGFLTLAAHIWFSETHHPWNGRKKAPLLGTHDKGAIALLYNGVLGDRSVNGGNVLTRKTLAIIREALPPGFDLPLTIYGERSALGDAALKAGNITFKQTPYDVKARR